MCTGMKDWLAEVEMNGFSKGKYAGKTEGKIEDLTIALQIISDLQQGTSESTIASAYDLNIENVAMFKESLHI